MLKFISVNFNGIESAPFRLSSFRLLQAKYQHELCYLTFNEWDTSFDAVKPGVPVDIQIKDPKNNKNFYGYVHHIEPKKTPGSDNITVVVIGASYVFKQARQEVYRDITASDLAIKFAIEHNFSYGVVRHPRVFPQIAQSGQSDWQLLVKLAKQCGYSLRAENTELYFQPLTEDFTAYKAEAQTFYMNDANNPSGSTIYSFNPIVGETLSFEEGSKSATAVSGIDIVNGESAFAVTKQKRDTTVRKNKQDEFFDRFESTTVATDFSSAVYEAESADLLTRYPYRASVEVLGNASLRPELPIYLEGLGSDYSGYWTILETEHLVNNLVYTTKLVVGLDSLGKANIWSDGTSLDVKPSPDKRTITPGKSQTNIKQRTILKTIQKGVLPSASYSPNQTKNKTPLNTTEKTIAFWANAGKRDLKSVVKKTANTEAVYNKLRGAGVL